MPKKITGGANPDEELNLSQGLRRSCWKTIGRTSAAMNASRTVHKQAAFQSFLFGSFFLTEKKQRIRDRKGTKLTA
ncbi:MAG: hypothetical protein NT067_03670 [Candidatus Diapherotrites archaeon]|nr:hypothetical protein [Candidatus Diapherotrites archaeon]